MKLRLALKICRGLDRNNGFRPLRPAWRWYQIDQARRIGRKKWRDNRFPYIPSEREIEQQGQIMASVFAGLAVQFADEQGVDIPAEIREHAFDFSDLTNDAESGDET